MKLVYACGKIESLKPLGKGRYRHEDGSIGKPSKSMKAENSKNGFVKIASRYPEKTKMNRCQREAKDLVAAGECEGGCVDHGGHSGKRELVRVIGSDGNDFGLFSYCETAKKIDQDRGMKVKVEPIPSAVCQFNDDKEPIDRDWLSEWAKKEPHVWSVPGTSLAVYYNQSGLLKGIWTILETLDDGDELDHCHVVNRGECRRMIDLLTSQPEEEKPSDYPHWAYMTDAQKDESIRKAY